MQMEGNRVCAQAGVSYNSPQQLAAWIQKLTHTIARALHSANGRYLPGVCSKDLTRSMVNQKPGDLAWSTKLELLVLWYLPDTDTSA